MALSCVDSKVVAQLPTTIALGSSCVDSKVVAQLNQMEKCSLMGPALNLEIRHRHTSRKRETREVRLLDWGGKSYCEGKSDWRGEGQCAQHYFYRLPAYSMILTRGISTVVAEFLCDKVVALRVIRVIWVIRVVRIIRVIRIIRDFRVIDSGISAVVAEFQCDKAIAFY